MTKGKKKEVMCFQCKKVGHYLSEFEEELPKAQPQKVNHALLTMMRRNPRRKNALILKRMITMCQLKGKKTKN